jgi:hypothetical protein
MPEEEDDPKAEIAKLKARVERLERERRTSSAEEMGAARRAEDARLVDEQLRALYGRRRRLMF